MFVKIKEIIINTDCIIAINQNCLISTKEEPYVIYLKSDKHVTITEKQYKKLIELIKPLEVM